MPGESSAVPPKDGVGLNPSEDIAANRTSIGTTPPPRARRSGGGASDAARSFGKPQVGGEARGSPPAGQHGFENWRLLKRKRRRKESSSAHRGSHHDLTNGRNPCVFRSDGVFGMHRWPLRSALCARLYLYWSTLESQHTATYRWASSPMYRSSAHGRP
jgi:hypothetical protein